MMQKRVLLLVLLLVFFVGQGNAIGIEHPQLKAFFPAKKGQQRFVIVLPHKERGEEDGFQVEIIPGKNMLTDGVNQTRLGRTIIPKPLEGWGYTYYEVTGDDVALSTMMAAPAGAEKITEFVTGTSIFVGYNSRLPIVIYAPDGVELRFRIWNTSPDFEAVPKG